VRWFFQQHPYLVTRIQRTGAQEKNVEERFELWRAARDGFYEHPLAGVGYGQFRHYANATHHLVAKVTHETYLSYAAEAGLLGLVIWLWLLADVIIASMRWRLVVGDGLSTMALAFVLGSCVQGFFNNVDQFRSLWIVVGLVAAIGAARERELRWISR
jgi:O-antigen ligase